MAFLRNCQVSVEILQKPAKIPASFRTRGSCNVSMNLVQAELLVELGHASAGIDQLLLASEEGVTLRADFHLDILLGRTCLNHITAGASNSSLLIIGMDSFLHARVHPLSDPVYLCLAFTPQKQQ